MSWFKKKKEEEIKTEYTCDVCGTGRWYVKDLVTATRVSQDFDQIEYGKIHKRYLLVCTHHRDSEVTKTIRIRL